MFFPLVKRNSFYENEKFFELFMLDGHDCMLGHEFVKKKKKKWEEFGQLLTLKSQNWQIYVR